MKSILTVFILLIFINNSIGQSLRDADETKRIADKYFENNQYKNALENYQGIVNKEFNNPEIHFKIAACYRMLFQYQEALKWYQKTHLINKEDYPLALYYEALMLKLTGNYQEALNKFQDFEESAISLEFKGKEDYISQSKVEQRGCNFAIEQEASPFRDFNLERIEGIVNSSSNDYSTVILDHDSLIIVSSGRNGNNKMDERLAEPYSDNLRFIKNDKGWQAHLPDDKFGINNTNYGEGAGVLNFTKDRFYFTRCGGEEKNCVILYSELKDGKWQKPQKLNENINTPGSDTKHPALTKGEDTLIFVSDRIGGEGQNDLWMSVKEGGNWQKPVNCGSIINTPFNEISPFFMQKEGFLSFSSEGHHGFGGYDIFIYKGNDFKNELLLINPGIPFNSHMDDAYFSLGENVGYLSSNRSSNERKFDVFSFDIKTNEEVITVISNNQALAYRDLYKKNEHSVFYEGSKKNLLTASNVDQLDSTVTVTGKLLINGSDVPASEVSIPLVDSEGNVIKYTTTNQQGEFRYTELPLNQDMRILANNQASSMYNSSAYKVTELELTQSEKTNEQAKFETIYFDFEKSFLRSEAKKTLDEIIQLSKQNSDIQIEINAYTDIVGGDNYNIFLSDKRGDATFSYLLSGGMDRTAIVKNAYGKQNPVATNTNIYGRQLNRRVEILVKGINSGNVTTANTYILQPKATLYSIAKAYGMTVDELKELNGLTSDKIEAYRPLRVINRSGRNGFRMVYSEMAKDSYHIIKKGESLASIAQLYKMTVDDIASLNELNNQEVFEGQQIRIKPK